METDLDLIELQLSEVEMLRSMFPKTGEFDIDDPSVLSDARSIVDSGCRHAVLMKTFRQITFTVKINIAHEEPGEQCVLQLYCQLPQTYPQDIPELLVRSTTPLFSRQQQKRLNDDLAQQISSLERGELCIGEAIQWIQENASKYIEPSSPSKDISSLSQKPSKVRDDTFTRLWIHSHHIYSKIKRRAILEWGSELQATGFCLPGKPGVICIEGLKSSAEEFWNRLRRMNWKKISCKHREDFSLCEVDPDSPVAMTGSQFKLFAGFEEKVFAVHGGRDYHMDLGLFFKFLEAHNCSSVFKLLLGVDGKASKVD